MLYQDEGPPFWRWTDRNMRWLKWVIPNTISLLASFLRLMLAKELVFSRVLFRKMAMPAEADLMIDVKTIEFFIISITRCIAESAKSAIWLSFLILIVKIILKY